VSRETSGGGSDATNESLPAFSVVMAAYNSAPTIGQAIESVRSQTRSDWELLVVDDGSRDETADIAEAVADPRVRVVRTAGNRGPAAARNRGISLARAPLVCTLDSDDLWLPHYLDTMARTLDSNPAAAVACTDAWVLEQTTGRVRKKSAMAFLDPPEPLPDDTETFLAELLRRNFVYNSVTARRDSLRAVGGYDERLWIGEDWELWLRLAAAGFRFVRVPRLLAVYRQRADSLMTSHAERLVEAKCEVYRVVAEEWDASPELRDLALRLSRASALRSRRRAAAGALLGPAFALRKSLREARLWHREPPREVAELLLTVAGAQKT
jgi:glycosyltransferase involved in cell wall biosynthesis